MARNSAAQATKPPTAIADPVSVGGTPGAPNVGQKPTKGDNRVLRADPRKEYLAGTNWAQSWYLNLARSLPPHIDALEAEVGDDVYTLMYTDPQVAASGNVFKAAVMETGPSFTAALEDEDDPDYAQAQFIADWCTSIFADLKTSIDDVLWNLGDAFFLGNKVAELIWDYSDQYWAIPPKKPKPTFDKFGAKIPAKSKPVRKTHGSGPQLILTDIKVKPRESVGFLVDAFENVLGILGHIPGNYYSLMPGMVYADISQIPNLLPLDKFAVLTFRPKDSSPLGSSMLRPAYEAWYIKGQLWGQYGLFLATMAGGMISGTPAPNQTDEQIQDATGQATGEVATPEEVMLQNLLKAKNGAVLVNKPGSVVDIHYPASDGSAFLNAFELLNLEMTKGILHVTLATEEGKHQARAAAEVHADVLQLLIRVAKQSVERMIRGILQRMIAYNYGDSARRLVPNVSLGETDSADQSKLWTSVAALMTSGYFSTDQLPQVDQEIGMPVRLPLDPDDPSLNPQPAPAAPSIPVQPVPGSQVASTGTKPPMTGTDAGLQPENVPVPGKVSAAPKPSAKRSA